MSTKCTTYEQVENYVLDRMKQGNFLGITSQYEKLDGVDLLYLASWANEEIEYQAPIATDCYGDTFDVRQFTSANDLILDICKQNGIKLPQPPTGLYRAENGKYKCQLTGMSCKKCARTLGNLFRKPVVKNNPCTELNCQLYTNLVQKYR